MAAVLIQPDSSSEQGFSLIETVIALGVLAVGVLGTAAAMTTGMQNLSSSASDVIVTQKAAQLIEAVFSARDSHKLTWAQIRNGKGASGSDNGVFLDGPQSIYLSGPDGLVNTADDLQQPIETTTLPGRDQVIGTGDDTLMTLSNFTREVVIRDIPNENGELRSIVVTITYRNGQMKREYKLVTYISAFS
jgi:prepilin-type N-terminal cleavage/methylation domain-containing protein